MKKIISYLGFARKSNNIIIGQSSLKASKQKLHLILVCNSASNNLKDLARNLATKHKCELIVTLPLLSELINLDNVKIIGITDYNLSKGIYSNKESIKIG